MPVTINELSAQTDALQKDYTFLSSFGIDLSLATNRSSVTQRTFAENGSELHTFVKIYSYKKHFLHRLWRKGTARLEARNLLFFNSIGISAPRVMAWGQRKNAIGKMIDDYIITETVTETQTLDDYIAEHCPDRSQALYCSRRDSIIDQLSKATRSIHAEKFYHQDLKWRNVLARNKSDGAELFWIDCPKGDFTNSTLHQSRRALKDCATLDKLARIHCTRDERLRFVAGYLERPIDAPEVSTFAQAIANYRRKRFDAEDDRQAIQRRSRANAQAHAATSK